MLKGRESLLEKKMNTLIAFIEAIAIISLTTCATLTSVALLLCDEERFEVKAEMIIIVILLTAMITTIALDLGGFIVT